MKKFISAVTSICMTATMFAAAVPASVNAQDASKTLSLRHLDSNANAYTVSAADIAAGEVTIPCGLFLEEATEGEIAGILATWHVASAADESAITLETTASKMSEDYYTEDKTYTLSDGTEFTTKKLPFFSGSIRRGAYSINSTDDIATYNSSVDSLVYSWISVNGSTWLGATSDEFPCYYFNVKLAQNAAPGEYVIDFNDYFRDAPTNLQPSNTLGAMTTNYEYTALLQESTGEGLLNFEPLTITVEGDVDPGTTTTTTPAPTPGSTTTTTTPDPTPSDAKIVLDYLYEDGMDYYKAEAGDTIYVDMTIDAGDNEIISAEAYLKADEGLQIDYIMDASEAFGGAGLVVNWLGNPASQLTTITDPNGTAVSATFNGKFVPAVVPTAGGIMASMDVTIPAGTPDGIYYIDMTWVRFAKDQAPTYYDAADVSYTPAKIVVGDVEEDTTTTTPEPVQTTTTTTTTAAPVQTTTTTTPAPGERYLGDANCDGKVNVADVVVLNKELAGVANLVDQGKINAEVTAPTFDLAAVELTYDDSTYIIQSIIHLWTLTDNGPVATEYNTAQ